VSQIPPRTSLTATDKQNRQAYQIACLFLCKKLPPMREQIQQVTLEEKIGQMLIAASDYEQEKYILM
jgi:hypothetical protein